MKNHRALVLWSVFVLAFAAGALALRTNATAGTNAEPSAAKPEPVERDMHEFMEYVFEPGYKRLRAAMAEEPADRAGWKPIKGDGLALAESANLLLFHRPEAAEWTKEDDKAWDGLAVEVRDAGGRLYLAAKKRDFTAASTHYRTMLARCNACHDRYAGGKHQLEP